MKLKTLLIGLILINSLDGQSQQVVTTTGDYFATSEAQLSWTLGELMTATFTASDVQLTQGEQQSLFIYANVNELSTLSDITIYPNPFLDVFTIQSDGTPYEFNIHSTTGQLILEGTIQNNQELVDLSTLESGVYYIRVYSGQSEKTVKLIKN